MTNIAKTIVKFLETQDVRHVWGVPGESYLAVLDGLHDSKIKFYNTRHEGAASMAAEAEGKLTSRPGVCFVTRGPGAMNAAHGIHISSHDNTPMIMFIGQVPHKLKGRGAFQELDYQQIFGSIAKDVIVLDEASRAPLDLMRGWRSAIEGRGGPVIFVLPEDCLNDEVGIAKFSKIERNRIKPNESQIDALLTQIKRAIRPVLIVGGSQFSQQGKAALEEFSSVTGMPVLCSFRRQMYFDHTHIHYAGDLGHGCNPALLGRIKASDMIILLGAELEEVPSQSYSLLQDTYSRQKLIVIGQDSNRTRLLYASEHIIADPDETIMALNVQLKKVVDKLNLANKFDGEDMHKAYETWVTPRKNDDHDIHLHLDQILCDLGDRLPEDAILTNGAGNYALWLHRYFPFKKFGSQLAPISGSMGYGLPAGIAAKANYPDRSVVVFAGDGCLQMSINELITAKSLGLNIVVLVFNNGSYGTIRAHQERNYPNRVSGTNLENPDFVKIAQASGFQAQTVSSRGEFLIALEMALNTNTPYLIELMCDLKQISPAMRLDKKKPV